LLKTEQIKLPLEKNLPEADGVLDKIL